jgi:heterodisulfide reductase subunit B
MSEHMLPLVEIREKKAQPVRPNPAAAPRPDLHEELFELEARGELIVQRVPEPYVEVTTKYGRTKKVPIDHLWHHKSCGQCGHILGYTTSIL